MGVVWQPAIPNDDEARTLTAIIAGAQARAINLLQMVKRPARFLGRWRRCETYNDANLQTQACPT
jgi:hypothetical protein